METSAKEAGTANGDRPKILSVTEARDALFVALASGKRAELNKAVLTFKKAARKTGAGLVAFRMAKGLLLLCEL